MRGREAAAECGRVAAPIRRAASHSERGPSESVRRQRRSVGGARQSTNNASDGQPSGGTRHPRRPEVLATMHSVLSAGPAC